MTPSARDGAATEADAGGECPEQSLLAEHPPQAQKLNTSGSLAARAAFCGIVNNASFCVLLGASQEIANEFGHSELQPLIVNISTVGSVIGVFFSSKVMVGHMGDRTRLVFVAVVNAVGYLLIGVAYHAAPWDAHAHEKPSADVTPSWGFWLCTLGALVLGFIQSAGEVMNLAIYSSFSPGMLGSWGAGTGLSGVIGPFLFITMHDAFALDVGDIGLVLVAVVPLYLLACWSIIAHRDASRRAASGARHSSRAVVTPHESTPHAPTPPTPTHALPSARDSEAMAVGATDAHLQAPIQPSVVVQPAASDCVAKATASEGLLDDSVSVSFTCSNLVVVWRFCSNVLVNMVAVYALEYMITSGFMQTVTQCAPTRSWIANSDNNNPLLWAMYNVGVTASRASVSCFRIRRIWVLTALQALNVLLWAVLAFSQVIARDAHSDGPLYALAVHMIFVGFMGGACYANCMYLFNTSNAIPIRLRELGINVGFFFSNLGIITATGLVTLLKTTVLSKPVLFPPDGACPTLANALLA